MDGNIVKRKEVVYKVSNPYKRRKEEEIRKILAEIEAGTPKREACRKYGLNRKTLKAWIRRLAVRNLAETS